MPGPIDPIRPIRRTSRPAREADEARYDDGETPNLPVPAAAPPAAETPRGARPQTSLNAHLLAQNAQQRGLRGGPQTLETARAAYLETQWSGPDDRRLRKGVITKTEI